MGEDASSGVPWVTFGFVRVRVRCALPAPADESDARTANSGVRWPSPKRRRDALDPTGPMTTKRFVQE